MKHLLLSIYRATILLLLLLSFTRLALAQAAQVEVTRDVNLRSDPSTDNPRIKLLHPPDVLLLIDSDKTDGYYHVRTQDGTEGWVWAKNVQISSAVSPGGTTGGVASRIDSSWSKGTPEKTTFTGNEGPCEFGGDGGDPDEYTLKNRADSPASADIHDVAWSAIDQLDYPGKVDRVWEPQKRVGWTAAQLAVIQPFEGVAVRVVGYLAAIKPQTGNSEGTNCGQTKAGDVDFHIALGGNSGDLEKKSIVIEFTPRFLKDHPNWKKSKMLPWLNSSDPVRVTG